MSTIGLIGLFVAGLAALIGSFLAISTVNLEALNPWFETMGTRSMGPTSAPLPTALSTSTFWEAMSTPNLSFCDSFVSPELAAATPTGTSTFAFVFEEEEDDWEDFTEESAADELIRQLGHLWQLLRRAVLRLLVNFNRFLKKRPYLGCEKRCEKSSRHFSWRILPIARSRPHGRSVTRCPVRPNYALRHAVFGLPTLRSATLSAAAPVALPSPSLPPLPSWPGSPPYSLSAFIARIRDLQQEVKDLKGQFQEMQRRQSAAASPVASDLPGAQPIFGMGSAPLQPSGFGDGSECNVD